MKPSDPASRRAAAFLSALFHLPMSAVWPAILATVPLALAGTPAAMAAGSAAAARPVEAFGPGTWPALQAGLKQPAVVVFSTTDCSHCPAVLASLRQTISQRLPRAQLMAVVMDQAPGEADAALIADAHYRPADRLLAFDGAAPMLRYAVDPRWRGVTPYVVFLVPGAPPRAVTGPPEAADLAAWLKAAR